MHAVAIPVKPLDRGKRRLAPILSPVERAALSLAMLEDALDAATAVRPWEVWVVSADEVALEVAARRGARPIPEERGPLGAAVRQVERLAAERGIEALAILHADLPLVDADALGSALRTLGSVVIAPSTDGGTNLLLRRPPRCIAARFGPESHRRHVEAARARGLPVAEIADPRLAIDLDGPDDILRVLDASRSGRARDVLDGLDVAARMAERG